MVRAIEASKQIVQTGTQQRSWDHWVLGKQIIDSGKLGQITFVQTYWYQHAPPGNYAAVPSTSSIGSDWLGPATGSAVPAGALLPVAALLGFRRRRPDRPHDALDRRRALVHGRRGAALGVGHGPQLQHQAVGSARHRSTTLEFPKNFICAYLGTYVSRVDDGGLEFRGDRGTLKIDRARLAFYRDDAAYVPGTLTPEPDISCARAATER